MRQPDVFKSLISNFHIGTFFGVPVKLHFTWIVCFWIISLSDLFLSFLWLSLFFIVVAHEFGHILMGRFFECKTEQVILCPLGGMALMQIPKSSFGEFMVAIAGPMVNVAFILPLYFLSEWNPIFKEVQKANFIMVLFNLLPIFPMDGGRVLRSFLYWVSGDYLGSTKSAVYMGRIFACSLFLISIFHGYIFVALIAVMMTFAGTAELEIAEQRLK